MHSAEQPPPPPVPVGVFADAEADTEAVGSSVAMGGSVSVNAGAAVFFTDALGSTFGVSSGFDCVTLKITTPPMKSSRIAATAMYCPDPCDGGGPL